MKPQFGALLCLFAVLAPSALPAGELHPGLRERLAQAPAAATLPVILRLEAQLDLRPYAGRASAGQLIRDLQALAAESQAPLLAALAERGLAPGAHPLWIDNCIALRATPAQIAALAALPGLARIDYDEPVVGELVAPVDGGRNAGWSQVIIGAPEVWSDYGLDGTGVVLGSMDTGADIGHPALAGKWRGGDNSWLDLVSGQPAPYDDHGHGTHTIGTMVGGDGLGPFTTDIGTAPGARFIAVKVLDANNSFGSASIVIAGAQWMLDPDGDADSDDFPRVVNNSWYFFSQTYDGYHATVAV
jgi:bacillopeptidase F